MPAKRKKLKKRSPHYKDPKAVDPESVAGTMRAKNQATKDAMDEADKY